MSRHVVHIYAVVRVPIEVDVPDGSPDDHIVVAAEAKTDLHELFRPIGVAFGDEVQGYMIEDAGDAEYRKSRYVKWKYDGMDDRLIKWNPE